MRPPFERDGKRYSPKLINATYLMRVSKPLCQEDPGAPKVPTRQSCADESGSQKLTCLLITQMVSALVIRSLVLLRTRLRMPGRNGKSEQGPRTLVIIGV